MASYVSFGLPSDTFQCDFLFNQMRVVKMNCPKCFPFWAVLEKSWIWDGCYLKVLQFEIWFRAKSLTKFYSDFRGLLSLHTSPKEAGKKLKNEVFSKKLFLALKAQFLHAFPNRLTISFSNLYLVARLSLLYSSSKCIWFIHVPNVLAFQNFTMAPEKPFMTLMLITQSQLANWTNNKPNKTD